MKSKLLTIIAVLAVTVTACGGDASDDSTTGSDAATGADATTQADTTGDGDEGTTTGDVTVGLAVSTLQNPFFVTLEEGAQQAADDAGIELLTADAQDDAQTQANDLQNFISQGVDVIVVNPVDSAAVVPSVEAANDAGIPVVTVDRAAEGGEVASHIASDNVRGGELASEHLFEQIGGEGAVAMLEGVPGTSAARDRGEGFNNALEASDVDLVANQTANFNREEGFTVTQNILQSNPELVGIFAQNDEMALGAVEAAREAGSLADLVIVGFDATDDALAAIEAGDMAATVAQQPTMLGATGIETAVALANGEEVDAEQPVEVQLVTADNVAEFTQ